jgi:response regulator RpfG family c-di-GMP phosphodiesterase
MIEDDEKISVLYVDDEENNLVAFKASFRRHFNIYTAISADDAKIILSKTAIHVLITDQRMPGTLGTELLAQALQDYPDIIRILLTGYSDIEAVKDSINKGQVFRYLEKPWKEEDLKTTIEEAFELYVKNMREKNEASILKLTNSQLEFMLRQKLLS